jgi:3-oxoacyl-[acyl-carrier protein] reductase
VQNERVALITGTSSGFGLLTTVDMARAGFRVVATMRDLARRELLDKAVAEAQVQSRVDVRKLDVTDFPAIAPLVETVIRDYGRIDVLVNNAGITRDGLAVRMKPADWDLVLKINLDGAFLCIQQVLPGMMRNRYGRIINIASLVGQAGSPGQANYAASKAGLIGLTKALAQEMGSRGITVNAVAPGYVGTDMTKDLPEELKQKMLAAIPLGRMGRPEDIAAAVKFLAGEDAAYITGHVLAVNGGMYM